MEKWQLVFETSRPEQQDFNDLLDNEIDLIRFTGIVAKEIILTAQEHHANIDLVYEAVGAWIKRIGDAGIEFKSAKD